MMVLKRASLVTGRRRISCKCLTFIAAAVIGATVHPAAADVMINFAQYGPEANYRQDFDPNVFPAGWRYLWNAPVNFNTPSADGTTNPIGTSTNYRELLPTGAGDWTADGNAVPFGPAGATWLTLGDTFGHPGRGALQPDGINNTLDRFVIAEYTVANPGSYYIADSTYGPGNTGSAGRQVQVYVNNTLIHDQLNGGNETASFNASLGALNTGDRVYVAFGPDGNDGADGFTADFSVSKFRDLDDTVTLSVGGYRNDFDGSAFPAGWRYLWNAPVDFNTPSADGTTNPIGSSANYSELLATGTGVWTADGNAYGFSGPPVSQFLHFGADEGHPGRGALQPEGVGNNLDRFAIAEYTVIESGNYAITDSLYGPGNPGSGGREVQVYVNNTLVLDLTGGGTDQINFDTRLGNLNAGDRVYVALGPDGSDGADGFLLDYKIGKVFEDAVILAGYRDDFDGGTFPTGWRYLWNAPLASDGTTNPIGTSANYSELLATGTGVWTADGGSVPFGPAGAPWLTLGDTFGHPGAGASQDEGGIGNNLDRFVIAEYTVDLAGYYLLFDSLYGPGNPGSGGREVQLYVNDLLLFSATGDAFLNFDFDFGLLQAGDHMYVALGPDGHDGADGFELDFKIARYGLAQIAQVPEPATVALLGIALAGLGFSRRRKLH